MSIFETLKSACRASASFKNFSEIEIGVYEVEEFKFVETKFGKKLVVCTEEFMCFLPDRFSKKITTDEQLIELNNTPLRMKYDGRDLKRRNLIMVDFIKKEQEPQQDGQDWEWNQLLVLESQK